MKLFSLVVVSVLFCSSVTVCAAAPSSINDDENKDIIRVRKQLECGDGIFAQLAAEHKELEKYYSEYKTYAKTTNSMLDECVTTQNPTFKKRCVYWSVGVFDMYYTVSMEDLQAENEVLTEKLTKSFVGKCGKIEIDCSDCHFWDI